MKRLVLVGGGHAHLPALVRADTLREAGAEVTLVAPAPHHYYSGMGPGLLSGIYRPPQARIAVERLANSRGARFVPGAVASIDPGSRTLALSDGGTLPYDLVSFNTGSRVPLERLVAAEQAAVPVKPVENLVAVRRQLLGTRGRPFAVLVIGGGPAGVEVAANLTRLSRKHDLTLEITLVDGGDQLLGNMPPRAGRIARRALVSQGVALRLGSPVAHLDTRRARTAHGEELPFDLALVTTGIVPHPLYAASGLPTAPDGGLRVDRYLQAVGHPGIFGGGDCVSLDGTPLPRVGVYAIRQGPVLLQNLSAAVRGAPLVRFRPQRRTLLILNLGDGTGLVVWGPWVWRGRWGFAWKNHLDTAFMRRFQVCGELREG